eukprot:m.222334 g.222334  ORF g.222334 m.222334 type:complete len:976 (-) comp17253_c0_seq2:1661-4588(-)
MLRSGLLLLVSVGLAAAADCKAEDFQLTITPCVDNKLSELYCKTIDCNEVAGNPKSKFDLPCGCPAGQGLQGNTCQACTKGTFSPGGLHYDSADFLVWNKTMATQAFSQKTPIDGVTITCSGTPCNPWVFEDVDGGQLISGDNAFNRNIKSTMTLTHAFNGNGGLKMKYDVNAYCSSYSSTYCNGLTVYIDNQMVLPDKSSGKTVQGNTNGFATFDSDTDSALAKSLLQSKGTHEIKFEFSRTSAARLGGERVAIRAITLEGATDTTGLSSEECSKCPPGSFTKDSSATECTECGFFTKSSDDRTSCDPCEEGTISGIGASTCTTLDVCTEEDYYTIESDTSACKKNPDDNNAYWHSSQSFWAESTVNGQSRLLCNKNGEGAVSLPAAMDFSSPCKCPPGHELSVTGDKPTCTKCPDGKYNNGSMATCQAVDPGFVAVRSKSFTTFNLGSIKKQPDPSKAECSGDDELCTSCVGDCLPGDDGWQARGHYASSGRAIGTADTTLVIPSVKVQGVATLKYKCAVDRRLKRTPKPTYASRDDCYMEFEVTNSSGDIVTTFNCSRSIYSTTDEPTYTYTRYIPGESTELTVSVRFHQTETAQSEFEGFLWELIIENTTDGGGLEERPCRAGYKSNAAGNACEACPAGTSSTNPPSDQCVMCTGNNVSYVPGTPCVPCGAGTVAAADHASCDINGCIFASDTKRIYDLSGLGQKGGEMVTFANTYQTFAFNPCYTEHSDTTCVDALNKSVPTMACYSSKYNSRWYDIGSILGFEENSVGNSTLTLTSTTRRCGTGTYGANIHLICDPSAGRGAPVADTPLYTSCRYNFVWVSSFACPECGTQDYEVTKGECKGGRQRVTFTPIGNCTGSKEPIIQPCGSSETTKGPNSEKGKSKSKSSGMKSTAVIGIVLGFLALSAILALVVVQHRKLSSRYSQLASVARGTGDADPLYQNTDDDDEMPVSAGARIAMRDDDDDMLSEA